MIQAPDRFQRPIYSYAEADRIAGATRGTAKRWLRGYEYKVGDEPVSAPPVTQGLSHPASPGVSFFDLVEIAAIGRLKGVGWSLHAIRGAVMACQQMFDLPRPLVTERFKTDGSDFFVQWDGSLVEVGIGRHRGERAWDEVLGPFLATVEYEGDYVRRWWPIGQNRRVVIDPDFGFGLPVIAGSGVRTEIVYEQVRAFVPQRRIARDFNVDLEDVEHAIQFEASRVPA